MTADGWRPDWPAPAGVRALFTTRAGGVSEAPFDSLNLGDHVGDAPEAVAQNRRRLAQHTGTPPVFLRQVHGVVTADLNETTEGLEADACLATRPGRVCTVMVADCLPVLFTDTGGTVVAAAHAGWRGLAGQGGHGVLESVVAALRQRTRDPLLAWLGPCIGPDAFEVGVEVRSAFTAGDAAAAGHFKPGTGGRLLADLPALARRRLRALGVDALYGNDGSPPWCTVSQPSVFFSHRRDSARLGGTGRMAACIWRL